ncbi:adenosylcobalamin-dependent ribonucleoside-diphosphate reductase [Flavobacteriaceae bacterium TP-CH-4]|uniref:Vitamin B12-dependent ribonucleotide reductase n=1 Tax=Pelagihabitans pacificus TaxID=2696054 RepID=A0A967ATE6_9FLAO|nr:adenosylcobalamin-dependent ribonucleoside-diphosphate reductase [Pelagihabitans pacificus]NHF59679.1 adenosylcobalamin-dependent ribonucleoside-diphosphate reductase [Pelagihabitans pacificus]
MIPNPTTNAEQILRERYYLRDPKGVICETAHQLFRRVAEHVASVEGADKAVWTDIFYKTMTRLEFLPNSPTLMNAGLLNGQLSACFVLPIDDRLEAIFTTLKNAALIHQSGGGTGYNFSKLRPKDDFIGSSGGRSSGPIAFMKVYDAATEHVKQGGKRRGANMGILNVNHPDIEAFVVSKSDGAQLQNFNISVGITDDFMKAVEKSDDWELVNPRTQKVVKAIKASHLWDTICQEAWKTGDPGLIFLDTINRNNPTPHQGLIESTNPCGEVPLLAYESCNLGSLNLMKMLKRENGKVSIDWSKLKNTVQIAIRFLDNVISVNHYLLPQTEEKSTGNRKVGLGVMGWAELLISLGIPYASEDAVRLGEHLMEYIKVWSYETSKALATQRGAFPSWKQSKHASHSPLRNATCNSIAPTGSISVIADTSYSIEPLFALAYKRVGILGDTTQTELNSVFVQQMRQMGYWDEHLKSEVLKTGSIQHLSSIPADLKKLFETSLEIPWKYHLLHQQAFQKHTDNAVSKTINLPKSATVNDVSDSYLTAWKYDLKGITVFRDGSRQRQVLQHCSLNGVEHC